MVKPTPHVVLVTGLHLPGAEEQIASVLEKEKPLGFYIELLATPAQREGKYADLEQNARRLADDEYLAKAVVARMYLLAKKHGIHFDFAERHTDESAKTARDFMHNSAEFRNLSNDAQIAGDVETAVNHETSAWSAIKSAGVSREPSILDTLEKEARERGKILTFVGGSHIRLAKQLQARGVKVTLYDAPIAAPVSNMVFGPHLISFSRNQALRSMLSNLVHNYLLDRYGMSDMQAFHSSSLLNLPQLSQIKPREIEELIRGSPGTPVRFRAHFIDFLKHRGIVFPSNDEMKRRLEKFELPQARKVKVFEPKRLTKLS